MSEGEQAKQQTRYVYKFSLAGRGSEKGGEDEPSQADVQAYISEILGVKNPWRKERGEAQT